MMNRQTDIDRFYGLLADLEERLGGKRRLGDCHGRMEWPARGVYFFFEPGEVRSCSGAQPRVVRVDTQALTAKSKTTLWNRLSQHRGVSKTRGGNHRGSIFRLIVGAAMKRRNGLEDLASWGVGADVGAASHRLGRERSAIAAAEAPLEQAVSDYLGRMTFLWLPVEDAPGPRIVIAAGSSATRLLSLATSGESRWICRIRLGLAATLIESASDDPVCGITTT